MVPESFIKEPKTFTTNLKSIKVLHSFEANWNLPHFQMPVKQIIISLENRLSIIQL